MKKRCKYGVGYTKEKWKQKIIEEDKEHKQKIGHLEVSDCYEDAVL